MKDIQRQAMQSKNVNRPRDVLAKTFSEVSFISAKPCATFFFFAIKLRFWYWCSYTFATRTKKSPCYFGKKRFRFKESWEFLWVSFSMEAKGYLLQCGISLVSWLGNHKAGVKWLEKELGLGLRFGFSTLRNIMMQFSKIWT